MNAPFHLIIAVALTVTIASVNAQGANNSQARVAPGPDPKHTVTVVTEPFTLDSRYASMEGPSNRQDVHLLDTPTPELLWLTAIEANIVDANDDNTAMPPQLMCHANLDMNITPMVRKKSSKSAAGRD